MLFNYYLIVSSENEKNDKLSGWVEFKQFAWSHWCYDECYGDATWCKAVQNFNFEQLIAEMRIKKALAVLQSINEHLFQID